MKKLMIVTLMAVAALTASAQRRSSTTRRGAVGADGGAAVAQGKDARVQITRKAQVRSASLLSAPSANGNTNLGKVFKKPRQWIVPELEYQTAADWQDELMFTWHILLDAKTAKQPDKPSKDKEPVARYSYYTVAVRYVNIPKGSHAASGYSYYTVAVRYVNVPKGSHAASVVLPPSVLERYGEPAAIAVVITNKEGDILDGQNEGAETVVGKKLAEKWWENADQVMSAKDSKGTPLIARRQGLLDRSKTIFALINPDDYEMVQQ